MLAQTAIAVREKDVEYHALMRVGHEMTLQPLHPQALLLEEMDKESRGSFPTLQSHRAWHDL